MEPRPSPQRVLTELVAAANAVHIGQSTRVVPEPHAVLMRSFTHGGRQVARMKQKKSGTEIVITAALDAERQSKLAELVAKFLDATIA